MARRSSAAAAAAKPETPKTRARARPPAAKLAPPTIPSPIVSIEYVQIDTLKRWPRNPKLHDLDGIGASISRFGFVQPILVDEKTGQIVAGHGRLEALQKMRDAGDAPPARVHVGAKGEWLAPVLRGIGFDDEKAAEAYLIADNRMVELGGWDEKLLAESFEAVGEELGAVTGWSQKEIDKLLALAERARAANDRAMTPGDQENIYLNNGIRQVVFHMTEADYKKSQALFDQLQEEWGVKTNAGVFMRMVDEYAATRG